MSQPPATATPTNERMANALAGLGDVLRNWPELLRVIMQGRGAAPANDATLDSSSTSNPNDSSKKPEAYSDSTRSILAGDNVRPSPPLPPTTDVFTSKKKEAPVYYGCEKVKCPECEREVTAASLESHMNTHLPYSMRPYNCKLCDKRYAGRIQLYQHMRENHREVMH